MTWLQVHLTTGRHEAPVIERLLEELGALSVTLEDAGDEPLLEPGPGDHPVWAETVVTGLFEPGTDPEAVRQGVLSAASGQSIHRLETEVLEDRAWERAWMDDFRPMSFGGRLWICPSGFPPPEPGVATVYLDPGLAFGTGTHPTTRLCLEWLTGAGIAGKSVIDLGCGSGILAIAALKLGAASAIAIDHDPQALQATGENAEKNGVLDRLTIIGAEGPDRASVDIVVANILASTLIELEPLIRQWVRPGGRAALSGVLEEQGSAVEEAFSTDFKMTRRRRDGEWLLLSGQRR